MLHERPSESDWLLLDHPTGEILVSTAEVHSSLKVSEIVRIPKNEYPNYAPGVEITHFNLQLSPDRVKTEVALAKIKRFGLQNGSQEQLKPLLILDDIWIARMTKFIPEIKYDEIPARFLTNTIGGAHTPNEVRKLIWDRYSFVLPNKSRFEIMNSTISIRNFILLAKTTYQI